MRVREGEGVGVQAVFAEDEAVSDDVLAGVSVPDSQGGNAGVYGRRERAGEFLDRLINIALPRVRDFKGISPKAFDGRGNYTFGVREQIIFPEIDLEKVDKIKGMNITIVTSARTDEEGRALLSGLGMPFRKA